MEFISMYTKAENVSDLIKCYIAKILGAKVVTPLGRIVLLPKDYEIMAIKTGNTDMIKWGRQNIV